MRIITIPFADSVGVCFRNNCLPVTPCGEKIVGNLPPSWAGKKMRNFLHIKKLKKWVFWLRASIEIRVWNIFLCLSQDKYFKYDPFPCNESLQSAHHCPHPVNVSHNFFLTSDLKVSGHARATFLIDENRWPRKALVQTLTFCCYQCICLRSSNKDYFAMNEWMNVYFSKTLIYKTCCIFSYPIYW